MHKSTIENVTRAWPRLGWSGCFSKVIREEVGRKPWCHTTSLGDAFLEGVNGNEVMNGYA